MIVKNIIFYEKHSSEVTLVEGIGKKSISILANPGNRF